MQPNKLPPQTTVTAKQVAAHLGVTDSTVYELWDSGQMRSVRIGKKLRRTTWDWVREFIEKSHGEARGNAP